MGVPWRPRHAVNSAAAARRRRQRRCACRRQSPRRRPGGSALLRSMRNGDRAAATISARTAAQRLHSGQSMTAAAAAPGRADPHDRSTTPANGSAIATADRSESGVPPRCSHRRSSRGMIGSAVPLLFEADAAKDMDLLRGHLRRPRDRTMPAERRVPARRAPHLNGHTPRRRAHGGRTPPAENASLIQVQGADGERKGRRPVLGPAARGRGDGGSTELPELRCAHRHRDPRMRALPDGRPQRRGGPLGGESA